MNKYSFTLIFGVNAPSINSQLSRKGLLQHLSDHAFSCIPEWQSDADSIERLYTRGLINRATAERARRMLSKFIRFTIEGKGDK